MSSNYVFQSLEGPRTQSKYEQKGKAFLEDIRNLRKHQCGPIHKHQIDAVLNTHRLLVEDATKDKRGGPVLIVAPTGSGKSGMIFMLPYVLQSRKVLVLTPSTVISDQLGETFGFKDHPCFLETLGITKNSEQLQGFLEAGIIIRDSSDIKPDKLFNLVIVNAQKFGGRSKTTLSLIYRNGEIIKNVEAFFSQFDTLIVDEAHHFPAETWLNTVRAFYKPGNNGINKQCIFLTATPNRKMPDGTHQSILPTQRIAYAITSKELEGTTIRKTEFLEKCSVSRLAHDLEKCLKYNSRKEKRIDNHQAMILVRTRKEALDRASELNIANRSPHYAVPLISERATIKRDLADFTKGIYTVAVTCGLLREGYDNSSVTVVVILRNVKAKVLFDQFVGRCMRKAKFEGEADRSVATILSYKEFNQKKMWKERASLAKYDPLEFDDDDEKPECKK